MGGRRDTRDEAAAPRELAAAEAAAASERVRDAATVVADIIVAWSRFWKWRTEERTPALWIRVEEYIIQEVLGCTHRRLKNPSREPLKQVKVSSTTEELQSGNHRHATTSITYKYYIKHHHE